MKILFLQDNGLNESPALTELSALLLSEGHATAVLLERESTDLWKDVAAENPDLIVVPASILARAWVERICRQLKIKFPDVPVALAGSFPTLSRRALELCAADFAVVGEAERPLLGLIAALSRREGFETVGGLEFRSDGGVRRNPPPAPLENLDDMPSPDRGLYFDRYPFMAAFPWKKMLAGRGCFYECTFCYQPTLQKMAGGPAIRRKSAARVAAEARDLKERWPVRHVHFSDDLFVSDFRWIEEFSARWKAEAGLPYSINTTADFITEKTAPLLANSGCRSVAIGLETADETVRMNGLGKNVRNETVSRAASLIRDHGMLLTTFNILASPDDTFANALATLRYNAALRVDHARVTLATPLPGTKMADRTGEKVGADAAALRRYRNLYNLFNLGVAVPALLPLIERLVEIPWTGVLAPAGMIRLWQEKNLFGLTWREGFSYFRHVGMPDQRTANFVSLLS